MREIKFRLWDSQKKKWYKNSDCLLELDGSITQIDVVNVYDDEEKYDFKNRKDLVIMQYTGLKDQNSKEIYEGDICTIWMGSKQDNPYVVEDLRELYLDLNHVDRYYRITQIEVIGNIYENPELVQQ
jgi:uncharacterized phage protein (TIGR01671 family)